jgi:hypothetical protein
MTPTFQRRLAYMPHIQPIITTPIPAPMARAMYTRSSVKWICATSKTFVYVMRYITTTEVAELSSRRV